MKTAKTVNGKLTVQLTLDELRAVAEHLDLPLDPALDAYHGFSPAMHSAYMEIWRVYHTNRKAVP